MDHIGYVVNAEVKNAYNSGVISVDEVISDAIPWKVADCHRNIKADEEMEHEKKQIVIGPKDKNISPSLYLCENKVQ